MGCVAITFSVATFLVTLAACTVAWYALKLGMLKDLMRAYSTPDMARAIKIIWNFYKSECESNSQIVRERFKELLKGYKEHAKEIDDSRRSVSHFYQLMAVLYKRRPFGLDSNLLFKVWPKKDLKIIPDVIIPLEKGLVEHCGEKWNDKDVELLLALYDACAKACDKRERSHTPNRRPQPEP